MESPAQGEGDGGVQMLEEGGCRSSPRAPAARSPQSWTLECSAHNLASGGMVRHSVGEPSSPHLIHAAALASLAPCSPACCERSSGVHHSPPSPYQEKAAHAPAQSGSAGSRLLFRAQQRQGVSFKPILQPWEPPLTSRTFPLDTSQTGTQRKKKMGRKKIKPLPPIQVPSSNLEP